MLNNYKEEEKRNTPSNAYPLLCTFAFEAPMPWLHVVKTNKIQDGLLKLQNGA